MAEPDSGNGRRMEDLRQHSNCLLILNRIQLNWKIWDDLLLPFGPKVLVDAQSVLFDKLIRASSDFNLRPKIFWPADYLASSNNLPYFAGFRPGADNHSKPVFRFTNGPHDSCDHARSANWILSISRNLLLKTAWCKRQLPFGCRFFSSTLTHFSKPSVQEKEASSNLGWSR